MKKYLKSYAIVALGSVIFALAFDWFFAPNQVAMGGITGLAQVRLSHGGLTETAVDVRVILREALLANATTLTLIHNHPSGNARPSGDDDRITHKLKTACDAMRLYLIDHLIVTDGNYYSYAEEGKI